jgi:hypothetical protein
MSIKGTSIDAINAIVEMAHVGIRAIAKKIVDTHLTKRPKDVKLREEMEKWLYGHICINYRNVAPEARSSQWMERNYLLALSKNYS